MRYPSNRYALSVTTKSVQRDVARGCCCTARVTVSRSSLNERLRCRETANGSTTGTGTYTQDGDLQCECQARVPKAPESK
ncbi:hypothetical protein NDU88_002843 [Pleurodeles waltl]|uniref:Uncharacterized protein n=1 Tax=Pleurodeles waltl TaxID=8319 RepID=A0AAV7RD38_PLEWA|nr:hypothetical protein NDU88_002843 [Pleurodeles waltl]